ncbi:VC0807 family protein [Deinococcus alpinitundrae]|uniref:VC0807 family protein n=1 Tax=Deinococcus alpinitundrae TaxID=468913 RepID=UPI00137B919A|nr:VC0807 family protein [Deinococcus alpinitundrae]
MLKSAKPTTSGRRVVWQRLVRLSLDVVFTFVLPYVLLNPIPFGLPDLSLSLGNYGVYVLAGVLPTLYIVLDTLHRKVLNPFSLFLLAGALSGAAVSFLRLDGVAFALKDALHSALLVLVCGVSLLLRRPLFEFLFYGLVSPETPQRKQLLSAALSRPQVRRALGWATGLVALKALLLGTVSYAVAIWLVTLPFGVAGFNAQVARAHALTFPAAIILDLLFYGAAGGLTLQATRRLTGGRAWPWQEGFWAELERSTSG